MTVSYADSTRWTDSTRVRFHSNEAGSGETLICLHGGGPGANAWDNSRPVLDGLAAGFETILLDLPGYGRSSAMEPFEGETEDVFYSRALIAFMDARGIGSAHISGSSMSTSGVLRLAVDHPDRVARLVIKAPAGMPNWFATFPTPGLAAMFRFMKEQDRDSMEALVRCFVPRDEAFRQDMVDTRLEAAQRAPEMMRLPPPATLLAELPSVQTPALLLAGRDDRMVPFESALHLLAALPHAQLHVWGGGTGHFPEWEHPDQFVRLVRDFLASPA